MVSLSCSTTALATGTLVTAVVAGDAAPRRVRLANRLDGPVWPPRRQGVPAEGWDEDGFTGRVPAGGRLAVGYASPAPPEAEPLEIATVEAVSPDEDSETPNGIAAVDSAAGVVRELGAAGPPRDAIPVTAVGEATPPPRAESDEPAPEAVEAWLDAVENRVETAERLGDADSLSAATAALTDAGGLAAAEDLSQTVAVDAEALREFARRADELADRVAATDVPIETFERLA